MSASEIEIRVAALETEVSTLKNKLTELERPQQQTAWWKKISGTFAGDADYDEAMRLGREYRLSQKEAESAK